MSQTDIVLLLKAIREQYVLDWFGLHGVGHWARVYENGLRVDAATEANQEVLLLFSVFHDSRRVNDAIDRGYCSHAFQICDHVLFAEIS